MPGKVRLYFDTIKYLRWEQFFYRMYYRVTKPKIRSIDSFKGLGHRDWKWHESEYLDSPVIDDFVFSFLNEQHAVRTKEDWNKAGVEKLWLYNLHYFDDLNAKNSHARATFHHNFLKRWIDENPPPHGNGWEPYTLSLRIVNWVKWLSRHPEASRLFHYSLAQQALALSQRLEFHILGNHLFANAKALVFAGAYLDGDIAQQLLYRGLSVLKEQIQEQFLSDGGHYERSPMYHCILLNDMLDLIQLANITNLPALIQETEYWTQTCRTALHFLSGMTHPDNDISFFNDAAFGIAPPVEHIQEYATQLGIYSAPLSDGINCFEKSGYSRIEHSGHCIIFDHGPVGPDYLPGHAHADTLSFEWSHLNQRIIVNSGTSLYGVSQERLRQRQTPAHSTVHINNCSSSEVWSGFRVAKRACAKLIETFDDGITRCVTGEHDGYLQQKCGPRHTRKLSLRADTLSVTDCFDFIPREAIGYYHLAPTLDAIQITEHSAMIRCKETGKPLLRVNTEAQLTISKGTWHPAFGVSIPNMHIAVKITGKQHSTQFKLCSEA